MSGNKSSTFINTEISTEDQAIEASSEISVSQRNISNVIACGTDTSFYHCSLYGTDTTKATYSLLSPILIHTCWDQLIADRNNLTS